MKEAVGEKKTRDNSEWQGRRGILLLLLVTTLVSLALYVKQRRAEGLTIKKVNFDLRSLLGEETITYEK